MKIGEIILFFYHRRQETKVAQLFDTVTLDCVNCGIRGPYGGEMKEFMKHKDNCKSQMIGNFKKKKSRKWYWRSMTWVDEDPENPQSNKGLKCPGKCQKNDISFQIFARK